MVTGVFYTKGYNKWVMDKILKNNLSLSIDSWFCDIVLTIIAVYSIIKEI